MPQAIRKENRAYAILITLDQVYNVTPVPPVHANTTLDVHHLGNATIWTQTTQCFILAACAILDYMETES